jgi:putative membrane protein
MKFKHIAAICMVAVLAVSFSFSTSAAAQEDAGLAQAQAADGAGSPAASLKGKDEVIYARLTAGGAVDSMYAVNHFDALEGGAVVDYGDYESVNNLTDTAGMTQNGDSVSFVMNNENFYYQGNMTSTDLPWIFELSYYLNGAQTEPRDMAGKSGKMEMRIAIRQNTGIDPVFYDHYMLQITVTLDAEKCTNIDAPDGTTASAGKNKVITYTVMPETDADFSLKADVSDFTMTGVQIAGVPYSMNVDMPDMDDKLEDLDKLPDAISDLNDGVGELASGANEMKSGADELVDGSAGIKAGLDQLSGNAGQLISGSVQIKDALSNIAAAFNSGSMNNIDLSQMSQLPDGLAQLAQGLDGMSAGLTQLKDGFAPAYAALDSAIQGIPAGTVTQDDINALYAVVTDPAQQAVLNQLAANYAAAQTVKGTYAGVKAAFDGVGTTIDSIVPSIDQMAATLEDMSAQIGGSLESLNGLEQLGQLTSGLSKLSANYSSFHSGLVDYLNGVNTLASNYGAFHSGLASFGDGVGELDNGIGELHDGTDTLSGEVADLPDMMQEEIDKMKEKYLPVDFDPVSFTSSKNTDTKFVQFVLQCDGIEKPEAAEPAPAQEKTETFWDRLAALFTGGKE